MTGQTKRMGTFAALFFSVVTLSAQEPQAPALKLAVDLGDGSHVVGFPRLKSVSFQTSYAKMDIPLAEVSSVTVAPDHESASVVMQNGDVLKGVLTTGSIDLECAFGKIAIGAQHIKKIQVIRIGKGLSDSLLKGLVLRLAFDADEGQKANDSSPAGNNGTVHGATWMTEEGMGGVYAFDGQNDSIELGPSDTYKTQGQLSGCGWVFLTGRGVLLMSNYRGGCAYKGQFFFQIDFNGSLDILLGQGSGQYVRYSAPAEGLVPINEWHHIAFSYDESLGVGLKIKLYLDGNDVGRYVVQNEGTGGVVLQTADRLRIMANAESTGLYSSGKIDDVMLFKRALSADEIMQIYRDKRPSRLILK